MLGNPTELRACLISLEQMLDRARHLAVEYDEKIRKRDYKGSRVESLDNAISFPEVRSLDELCKDAIARSLQINGLFTAIMVWIVRRIWSPT